MAVGPLALKVGEKSPVRGDSHAGILWEPGGAIPPGDPTNGYIDAYEHMFARTPDGIRSLV